MVAVGGSDCQFISVVMDDKDGIVNKEPELPAKKHPHIERAIYKPVYERFITTTEDSEGRLQNIEFHPNHNFNFAYDVVDYLGTIKPDNLAMYWLSREKEEKKFTFSDMKRESSRAAISLNQ
jgi:acetyl-CoA synthetase